MLKLLLPLITSTIMLAQTPEQIKDAVESSSVFTEKSPNGQSVPDTFKDAIMVIINSDPQKSVILSKEYNSVKNNKKKLYGWIHTQSNRLRWRILDERGIYAHVGTWDTVMNQFERWSNTADFVVKVGRQPKNETEYQAYVKIEEEKDAADNKANGF